MNSPSRKYINNTSYQNEIQHKYYEQSYEPYQQQQQHQQQEQYKQEEYVYHQQHVYYPSDEYSSYKQNYEYNSSVTNENSVEYQSEGKDGNEYYEETIDNNGISEQEVENIFRYARHGRVDEIERLINRGIPIDVRDEHGNISLVVYSLIDSVTDVLTHLRASLFTRSLTR